MSRLTQNEELNLIDAIIAAHPNGIGISAIEAAIGARVAERQANKLNRRTLQRRLQKLLDEQRVYTEGKSIALVYRPGPNSRSGLSNQPAQALGFASPATQPSALFTPFSSFAPSAPLTAYKLAADESGPASFKVAMPIALAPTTVQTTPQAATQAAAASEPYVPLSAAGAALRDQVRRPLMQRQPVGYQRSFLESYQPGTTFYLPAALRSQLHIMGRTSASSPMQPAATHVRDILGRLLVDLSWASSNLEGNTYSQLDTQNLIEFGQIAKDKNIVEAQMILNHKAAIEMLIENADEVAFDAFTFKNLHAVLSQDLMSDPQTCGRLRWRPVDISGTVFYPLAQPQMLEDCFSLLLNKASAIADPFEQAFFLMVQLPYLQPFEDVNKRVSRIGANIPLFKHNLCPLSFIDVPKQAYIDGTLAVYEHNQIELLRDVFVWAYERSCQRYLAVKQKMVAPDPLKIKYREALIQAVQSIVKERLQPNPEIIARLGQQHAAQADQAEQAAFCELLSSALQQLHEGSIARYRLRRSEYIAWQYALSQLSQS